MDASTEEVATVPVPPSMLSVVGLSTTSPRSRRRTSFFADAPMALSTTRGPTSPTTPALTPAHTKRHPGGQPPRPRDLRRHHVVGVPFSSADVLSWCMRDLQTARQSASVASGSPRREHPDSNDDDAIPAPEAATSEEKDPASAPESPSQTMEPLRVQRDISRSESASFPVFEGSNDDDPSMRRSRTSWHVTPKSREPKIQDSALAKLFVYDRESRRKAEVTHIREEAKKSLVFDADGMVSLQPPTPKNTSDTVTPSSLSPAASPRSTLSVAMRKFRTVTSALKAQRRFRSLRPSREQQAVAKLRAAKALVQRDAMLRVATDLAFRGVRYSTTGTPRGYGTGVLSAAHRAHHGSGRVAQEGSGSALMQDPTTMSFGEEPAFLRSLRIDRGDRADQPLIENVGGAQTPVMTPQSKPGQHSPSGSTRMATSVSFRTGADGRPPKPTRPLRQSASQFTPMENPLTAPSGSEPSTTGLGMATYGSVGNLEALAMSQSGSGWRSQTAALKRADMTCAAAYTLACEGSGSRLIRSVLRKLSAYDDVAAALDQTRRAAAAASVSADASFHSPMTLQSGKASPIGFHAARSATGVRASTPQQAELEGKLVLDFGDTYCGPAGALNVVAALEYAVDLRSLSLRGCGLDDTAALVLCDTLRGSCPRLAHLDVSGNPRLTLTSGSHLYALAHTLRKLTAMCCDGTRLRPATIRSIHRRCENNAARAKKAFESAQQRSIIARRIVAEGTPQDEEAGARGDDDSSDSSSVSSEPTPVASAAMRAHATMML